MRLLVAILLCLAVSTANSQQAMRATDNVATTVTLRLEACANEKVFQVLDRLNQELEKAGLPLVKREAFRQADVLYQGKAYGACWTELGPLVLVIDDGGVDTSVFVVPTHHFSPVTAI